jgi:hypothetical protein
VTEPTDDTIILTPEDVARITSLDDLITFFKVDTEKWTVRDFRVNKWEQHSVSKGIVPLYQVRANLIRTVRDDLLAAEQAWDRAIAEMRTHAPPALPPSYDAPPTQPKLFTLAIMDPHLGMLAWDDETGGSYDLDIAIADYLTAASQALALAHTLYRPERVLIIVGNDLIHIDHLQGGKIGTTAMGTPQDFDSRLAKIFTAARKAVVSVIDHSRLLGCPVDVQFVPGNHDKHTVYKLGEVVAAWYRNDPNVCVYNSPAPRKYYQYGANLIGLTHGEEFKRNRDPLPLIMATEAPDLWGATTYREWLVGHFHATSELEYMKPRLNLSEHRSIRVRALPGLTAHDAWHTEEGYKHHRAASALVYNRSGGLYAYHEVQP